MEENSAFQKEKLQEEYNDSYWEKHYTICRERIPVFLEKVADKILNTGKYLNVVRQCGECRSIIISRFPLGLENLVKIGRPFPVRDFLKRLEKSEKSTQNTGKLREFQTNDICYFLVLFK